MERLEAYVVSGIVAFTPGAGPLVIKLTAASNSDYDGLVFRRDVKDMKPKDPWVFKSDSLGWGRAGSTHPCLPGMPSVPVPARKPNWFSPNCNKKESSVPVHQHKVATTRRLDNNHGSLGNVLY